MSAWPDLLGPAEEVAPRLLGAVVRHGSVAVRITEVEAYGGAGDPGSHAARGPTPRSAVMFGPAGHLYCYLSYGMHVCANVVIGEDGEAGGVLLRAGTVVEGHEVARARRPAVPDTHLARGPALLGRTLDISLALKGTDLSSGPVVLELAHAPAGPVAAGPRVGLRQAADRPWRFWIRDDPSVSAYRRHPKAAVERLPGA